jgi:hypothetical protein
MSASPLFDASAYRALARTGDTLHDRDTARAIGRALSSATSRDGTPRVSPFVLWALLADVAAALPSDGPGRSKRGPTEAERGRAARARIGLAICAAHAPAEKTTPGAHGLALAIDPDSAACLALGLQPPNALTVWNEYLASLASEVAADPTVERAQRLAAPLAHVAERARAAIEDFSDEMQDAVLTTYDSASGAWGWDDDTSDDERQRALTSPLPPRVPGVDDPTALGGSLMVEVLRRDPLLRAVASGRAARAHAVIARAAAPTADGREPPDVEPASLVEVAHLAERFPVGLALGRELLRRVIAGDLEVAERSARRWLWDLQATYGLVEQTTLVTGNVVIAEATAAGVQGIEPLPAFRTRVGV